MAKNTAKNFFTFKFAIRTSQRSKRVFLKSVTVFVVLNLLFQTFYPTIAFALTGGPSQPEMQGFTPIGVTNMVDLSSGSFTYNIPLMDVEGYPINLSYHSGITMDQEASWVGLGWNINVGEIARQMRGLPDDFKGDTVTKTFNMKTNYTIGLTAGEKFKIFGFPDPKPPTSGGTLSLSANIGVFYNNYKGPGLTFGISPSLNSGQANKGPLTASLGVNFNSQSGVDIAPSVGLSAQVASSNTTQTSLGLTVGTCYNSRSGLKAITMTKDLNFDASKTTTSKDDNGKTTTQESGAYAGGESSTSTYSFASPCYTPTMTMPMSNYAATLDVTIGTAIIGTHPDLLFSGYYNEQKLATNTLRLPAYGYMNADAAENNPYALHDFNREKDVPYQQNIANLPITNFTYDLFSISGQGVSGQFRPFRGDVGILYDHECSNTSLSGNVGVEFGGPPDLLHGGIQLGLNYSQTTTDQWTGDNDFANKVSFQSLQPGNTSYEPFYIKSVGEKTINDTAYYTSIGGNSATNIQLDENGGNVRARNIFDYNNSTMLVPANLTKTRREKREQVTSILSAAEANYMGLDKKINSYPYDTNVFGSCALASHIQHISRLTWPGHHMSEITVTNPDGKRYVYGIPAYNIVQQEATFAINTGPSPTGNYYVKDSTNIVKYDTTKDNSINNTNGLDGYFEQQQLPPYAHSFLLTGILSPDYVDLTNDGITDDDLGQAVKINYTRVYSQAKPFRWRTPIEKDSASYQIGLMSYSDDDKANYVYGEKEVWYVHSVESKTMVAQFILENRYDGFGVKNRNGGIDTTQHLSCLKEIILYSKADLIKHGNNAIPIKTVHFVYNYSLCPGTPNSDVQSGKGKLTLKEVYFTYGNNTEGSLNSYQFTYSSFNPSYNHNHYDRWGYYKDNSSSMPPNEDFSYVLQDSTRTNLFATAWNLTGIQLPSGGNITVKYESNDYGYVQNQRAGQMCLVTGVGYTSTSSPGSQLYGGIGPQFNDWIFVQLPTAISSTQDFYNKYLAGVDSTNPGGNQVSKLYFRFLMNVGNATTPAYEYVPGYCDINSYQMVNSHLGAIQLKETPPGDPLVNSNSANPIAMASWQFLRLNLPWIAYPGSKVTGSVLSVIECILGIIPEVIDMFMGFDDRCVIQSFGRYVVPNYSYIRLDNPNYKKLGGGTRVKEIDISDNWASMAAGQSTFQYGQTFKYTNTSATGQVTSTGVATYEPMVGGDENPLHQPLPYPQKYLLAPNNSFYTETPLGECLYPSPGIVYSKVTVANLYHPGVSRTATGYTVNEFYTGYDFPVLNNWTDMTVDRIKPNILSSLLSIGVKDLMNVSQGFVVETNDMAGKEKAEQIYDQTGALISSTQYYYKVDNPNVPNMHLNNDVQTIETNGAVTTTEVGEDIDVAADMREQNTQTYGVNGTLNVESFSLWIIPLIIIPIIVPSYSSELTQFRSAVTTKYIHRCGLVDHIIKIQNGSQATTQNLLYDGETGEVLVSQTNNEFNKPIYSLTYPAHWAYDGMGPAYENIGLEVPNVVTNTNGQITSPSPGSYFAPGDEVEYYGPSGLSLTKGWVTCPVSGEYVIIDVYGNPISMPTPGYLVKIIRSGRKNMSSIPIGKVESMVSPITTGLNSLSASTNILQASATTYSNLWQIPYNSVETPVCVTSLTHPDTCLIVFLAAIIDQHSLFVTPADNIVMRNYLIGIGRCDTWYTTPYYALTEPVGEDYMSYYQAMLGNNILTISSLSGNPISFDSLSTYYYRKGDPTFRRDSINSQGCLLLFPFGKDSLTVTGGAPSYTYLYPPAVATACISNTTCHDSCENLAVNNTFNPYAQGILGSWRPQANYSYYYSRSPSLASTTSNIWSTGVFTHFTPAWTGSGVPWTLSGVSDSNWIWSSKVTKYDQKGNEVEDVDALGRYSSALYGYVSSLPVAVASNAKYKEIAFDGFEDYGFSNSCNSPCDNSHFSYISYLADTTSTEAHTGKYSLKLASGTNASVTRSINYYNGSIDTVEPGSPSTPYKYVLLNGGNIPLFSPDNGSYLLSAWVKESTACGVTGYTKDSIVVNYTGSSLTYVMKPAGPVIEGWQRFENKFMVPPSATAITVKLVAGSNTAYYDDIRMEPFASEMKTYVYDPSSLRLMATLDENNYATMYEYNDEGILMRVKKETEKGVMTIKESRSSYPRN